MKYSPTVRREVVRKLVSGFTKSVSADTYNRLLLLFHETDRVAHMTLYNLWENGNLESAGRQSGVVLRKTAIEECQKMEKNFNKGRKLTRYFKGVCERYSGVLPYTTSVPDNFIDLLMGVCFIEDYEDWLSFFESKDEFDRALNALDRFLAGLLYFEYSCQLGVGMDNIIGLAIGKTDIELANSFLEVMVSSGEG